MQNSEISRRTLGIGAGLVGVAALASMKTAVAQSMAEGGNWFDMIKAQHVMIAQTLDRMLNTTNAQAAERTRMEKRLTYLLTAHAVAEENVIYPALTRFGMTDASNRLYMEQAHAKVGNADLVMSPTDNDQWREEVATLRTAILHHAKDEEEADIFPRLMQAAGPMNGQLTMLYAQQFATVQRAA